MKYILFLALVIISNTNINAQMDTGVKCSNCHPANSPGEPSYTFEEVLEMKSKAKSYFEYLQFLSETLFKEYIETLKSCNSSSDGPKEIKNYQQFLDSLVLEKYFNAKLQSSDGQGSCENCGIAKQQKPNCRFTESEKKLARVLLNHPVLDIYLTKKIKLNDKEIDSVHEALRKINEDENKK